MLIFNPVRYWLRVALVFLLMSGLLGQPPQAAAQPPLTQATPLRAFSKASPTWPAAPLVPVVCNSPNLAIPNNGTVSDIITLTDDRTLSDLNLSLNVTQADVGNLLITLEHLASGRSLVVLNKPNAGTSSCTGSNLAFTLNDDGHNLPNVQNSCVNASPAYTASVYTPAYPLSAFDGLPVTGDYRLTIKDTGGNTTAGTLNQWCLDPYKNNFPAISVVPTNPPLTLRYSQLPNTVQTRTFTMTNSVVNSLLDWEISEEAINRLLYDNGPLFNSPGTGPSGADESLAQRGNLGVTALAFDARQDQDRSVADDFTVPASGWWVNRMVFWSYENLSTNNSTITQGYYRLWNTTPNAAGTGVVAGNMLTNELLSTSFANTYRRFDNEPSTTNSRPVMRNVVDVGAVLVADHYWAEWAANGDTNLAGPYLPFMALSGTVATGNAMTRVGTQWALALASGTNTPQGVPFQVYGYPNEPTCMAASDVPWITDITPSSGETLGGNTVLVSFRTNTTALATGWHTATICIASNDPINPAVPITVAVNVNPNFVIPALSYSPSAVAVSLPTTSTLTRTLWLTNTGETGSNLVWGLLETYGSAPELEEGVTRLPALTPDPAAFTPAGPAFELTEHFTNIANLPAYGWAMLNHSQPPGPYNWTQGNPGAFAAQAGAANSYIGASEESSMGTGTISNWLLTPELDLYNGATLTFYTRVRPNPSHADRLEVRLSTSGASTDVGTTAFDVGKFTHVLTTINPSLIISGYPTAWTAYSLVITNVSVPTTGRVAFRYFVTNGGPTGSNSDYIGIDTVTYRQPDAGCYNATDMPWLTVSSNSGLVTTNNSMPITLTFNSTGRTAGEVYTGKLCLVTNDPNRWLTLIPITFTVAPTYVVNATPDSANKVGAGGHTVVFQVLVTNTSNIHDTYTTTLLNTPAFSTVVPNTLGSLGAGATLSFTVQVQIPPGTTSGTSTAIVRVRSVGNPSVYIDLTLQVQAVPPRYVYLPLVRRGLPCWALSVEQENNNTYQAANGPLCSAQTYAATSDVGSDWFYVDAAGGTLQAEVLGLSANEGTQVILYSGSNPTNPVIIDNVAPYLITQAITPGRYYVRVYTTVSNVPYTLKITYP